MVILLVSKPVTTGWAQYAAVKVKGGQATVKLG
jgi:hypothetical protein